MKNWYAMEKVTTKICMTKDVGVYGTLFGGNMLAWMDEAAAAFAIKKTHQPHMVTLRFGETVFAHPVRVGDIVEFYCGEESIGNTSFSFKINAMVEDYIVFRTDCTFVAVDDLGNPKPIRQA